MSWDGAENNVRFPCLGQAPGTPQRPSSRWPLANVRRQPFGAMDEWESYSGEASVSVTKMVQPSQSSRAGTYAHWRMLVLNKLDWSAKHNQRAPWHPAPAVDEPRAQGSEQVRTVDAMT